MEDMENHENHEVSLKLAKKSYAFLMQSVKSMYHHKDAIYYNDIHKAQIEAMSEMLKSMWRLTNDLEVIREAHDAAISGEGEAIYREIEAEIDEVLKGNPACPAA